MLCFFFFFWNFISSGEGGGSRIDRHASTHPPPPPPMILQTQRLFRLGLIDKQGAENVKIHKIDVLQRKTYCKITTYLYVNVSYIKASMPTRLFLSKKIYICTIFKTVSPS